MTYEEGARRLRPVAAAGGGRIRLAGPLDPLWRVQQLRRWLQQRGRVVLTPWLAQVAQETGLSYRGVTVRRQRSRWGSCSARHDISLNCALLFMEPDLVRHVLVHELAHTRYLNHGPAFWRLVARLAPEKKKKKKKKKKAWRSVPAWIAHDPV